MGYYINSVSCCAFPYSTALYLSNGSKELCESIIDSMCISIPSCIIVKHCNTMTDIDKGCELIKNIIPNYMMEYDLYDILDNIQNIKGELVNPIDATILISGGNTIYNSTNIYDFEDYASKVWFFMENILHVICTINGLMDGVRDKSYEFIAMCVAILGLPEGERYVGLLSNFAKYMYGEYSKYDFIEQYTNEIIKFRKKNWLYYKSISNYRLENLDILTDRALRILSNYVKSTLEGYKLGKTAMYRVNEILNTMIPDEPQFKNYMII